MDIEIKINCDNAAFEENPIYELTRILFVITRMLENHSIADLDNTKLRDCNGNTCGTIEIKE